MFHEFGDRLTEATVLAELGQAQMDLALSFHRGVGAAGRA